MILQRQSYIYLLLGAFGSHQGELRELVLSLERRGLRSPLKPSQIRIFPFGGGSPRGFLGLAERSFGFFLLTLLLESFLSIALG